MIEIFYHFLPPSFPASVTVSVHLFLPLKPSADQTWARVFAQQNFVSSQCCWIVEWFSFLHLLFFNSLQSPEDSTTSLLPYFHFSKVAAALVRSCSPLLLFIRRDSELVPVLLSVGPQFQAGPPGECENQQQQFDESSLSSIVQWLTPHTNTLMDTHSFQLLLPLNSNIQWHSYKRLHILFDSTSVISGGSTMLRLHSLHRGLGS